MPDTIHERVGKLEQESHTIKYQLSEIRDLRPRVSELERAFEGLAYLRADQAEIKTGIREMSDNYSHMTGDINGFMRAIKIVGAGLSMAAIVTAAVVWVLVQ